ncbi:active regulator of SIRT1 [Stigmatopora argus]
MSASLIRRGLDLLSDDIKSEHKVKKNKEHARTPSSAAARALVSTNRQGVSRQVKRLQGRLGPPKSKATVKDKRVKSALDEIKKKKAQSQMQSNLKYFMNTLFQATDSDTMKIQHHHIGRLSRDRPNTPIAQKPKETKSVFTEEEFQQFQKEYFGETLGKKQK